MSASIQPTPLLVHLCGQGEFIDSIKKGHRRTPVALCGRATETQFVIVADGLNTATAPRTLDTHAGYGARACVACRDALNRIV